jgi:hypothetical protein
VSREPRLTTADTTEAVDAFMKVLKHPAKKAVETLRAVILEAHPSIRDGVKWNAPSFRTTEYFATTNLRAKQGVGLILHLGAKVRSVDVKREAINDPQNLLVWLAKDRAMINFNDAKDLAAKTAALQALLRKWIRYV